MHHFAGVFGYCYGIFSLMAHMFNISYSCYLGRVQASIELNFVAKYYHTIVMPTTFVTIIHRLL